MNKLLEPWQENRGFLTLGCLFEELRNYLTLRDGSLERLTDLFESKQSDPNFLNDLVVLNEAIESLPSDRLREMLNL